MSNNTLITMAEAVLDKYPKRSMFGPDNDLAAALEKFKQWGGKDNEHKLRSALDKISNQR
jgi:hypothetical protein